MEVSEAPARLCRLEEGRPSCPQVLLWCIPATWVGALAGPGPLFLYLLKLIISKMMRKACRWEYRRVRFRSPAVPPRPKHGDMIVLATTDS